MKRSERIYRDAWRKFSFGILIVILAVCAGVWSVAATLEKSAASGGVLLFVVVAAGLYLSGRQFRETARLVRNARIERRIEREQSIRPRVRGIHHTGDLSV